MSRKYDVYCSLILYLLLLVSSYFLGKITIKYQKSAVPSSTTLAILNGAHSLAFIGLVFLFCFLRKQKWDTIGFSKTFALRSFLAGIALCLPLVIIWPYRITHILQNLSILRIAYYLIAIAFFEELVFRAYIGSRLCAAIKSPVAAFLITGLMFSASHIPYQAVIRRVPVAAYVASNLNRLILYLLISLVFQWLYRKYDSIVGPTILHFFWNFYRMP